MITAHIPAGYALAKSMRWTGAAFTAAIVGAVFPDIDLIWYFFIDDRLINHHRYWVHVPLFTVLASAILIVVTRRHPVAIAFAAGWTLHILLDAPTGRLMWLWPVSNTLYAPIDVPPTRSHWILSFLTHWSVVFEVSIWAFAATLFVRRKQVS
ncbi:MAG: metal-dependent hydrolase [Paracoccaceae bacterium]|nr:metal-dependent hydrolase [Paracoccaceae bacterium]